MQQVVFITGASSGIGKACASYLAKRGHIVYAGSRTQGSGQIPYHGLTLDVTDKGSIQSAVQEIIRREKRIDLLVNNAGYGIAGAIEDCSDEEIRAQFEVNFFGALTMIREVVPHMRHAGKGLIVTVGSIGGILGLPYQGIYSSTKFALMGLTEALRTELCPYNIKASIICPGDFATGFTRNRKIAAATFQDSPYKKRFSDALRQIEQDESAGADPILVARLVDKIMNKKTPKQCYMVGKLEQTLFAGMKSVLPNGLYHHIVARHYGQKK